MLYFFAKIGRKPWATAVVPSAGFVIASGYLGVHYFGQNLVRKLLSAETSDGRIEVISSKLQNLIKTVYLDVKRDFNLPFFKSNPLGDGPPTIKWFCSSTLDPVAFGMSEAKAGILIGVPQRYNYENVEDLPNSMFELRRINLFKTSSYKSKDSQDTKEKSDNLSSEKTLEEELKADAETIKVTGIDKQSQAGKIYAESLILSESGKKFSVARELFYADSYRILTKSFIVILSCYLSVYFSRAAVMLFKLKERHLANRLPFYGLSGVAGYFNYCSLDCTAEKYYNRKADQKAMNFGRDYQDGAIEYFNKIISRNKALRELFESEKYNFDEHGNLSLPILLRPYYWTYTDRLDEALSFKPKEEQNK